VLDSGDRAEPDKEVTLYIGGHQPDKTSEKLCKTKCLMLNLRK